ncbi:MAG: HEAT repeat domain-containing protein, partial [Kofleriaceae bacterium]
MTGQLYTLTPAEQQRVDRIDELVVLGGAAIGELVAAVEDPSWTVRRSAVAGLVALGAEAVAALARWLIEARTSERAISAVVDALVGSLGTAATGAALALLAHEHAAVAADGACILGRRHAVEATAALVGALGHADDNVAVASIEALGALGPAGAPAEAIEPLIAVVESRSFFRAFPALQVLARTGDPRTLRPIAALLDDPILRVEAIRALGRTGSAFAIAPLAALLGGNDRELARLVATALADLIARAEWSGGGAQVAQALRGALAPLLDDLLGALAGAEPADRAALIRVLGRAGNPRVLPVLAEHLASADTQALAIDAIRQLGRGHELGLLAALGGADPDVLASVLPLVGSTQDLEAVRGLLADDNAEVRARACEALARLGDTASVPALFAALADRNPRVALAATGAIQALQTGETAARAIAALATGTPLVRRHVLRIIAYLGFAEAFEPVQTATGDPDRRVAELAIAALGTLADPRADAALATLSASPDPGLRATTMRALGHRESAIAAGLLETGVAD